MFWGSYNLQTKNTGKLKKKCKLLKIKERRCTLQPKEDMHPKGEGKKKIESNKKSAKLGVKRKIVKEFFH